MKRLQVFAVRRRGNDGAVWTRAGVALVEADGSINIDLDVLPVDGRLHLRPAPTDGTAVLYARRRRGSAEIVREQGERVEVLASLDGARLDELFTTLANASVRYRVPVAAEWLRDETEGATVSPEKEGPP